jgi:DNA repair protein RecO (recombination protein O)
VRAAQRVWLTPAYLLHQYAYRDTSRIAEVFTREHGRLSLFARGVRAPKSALRGSLRPFQRLLVSWTGKTEAGQLTAVEIDGGFTQLPAQRLMSGFYLNELLLKLTERWDAHPELFDQYARAVAGLAGAGREEPHLRRFEKRLLEELGYGTDFSKTGSGEAVRAELYYRVQPQRALARCDPDSGDAVSGASLIELSAESFENASTLRDAKKILRASIEACLDGRPLSSREVMMALHRKEQA